MVRWEKKLTRPIAEQTYARESGPNQMRAAEIYSDLRTNVINNVYQVRTSERTIEASGS